jgi:hypothetical protein
MKIEGKMRMIETQIVNVLDKTPRLKKIPNKSLHHGNDRTRMVND